MYKGIEKNQNYTWLICAAQNMKNIIDKLTKKPKKGGKNPPPFELLAIFYRFFEKFFKIIKVHDFFRGLCQYSEEGKFPSFLIPL